MPVRTRRSARDELSEPPPAGFIEPQDDRVEKDDEDDETEDELPDINDEETDIQSSHTYSSKKNEARSETRGVPASAGFVQQLHVREEYRISRSKSVTFAEDAVVEEKGSSWLHLVIACTAIICAVVAVIMMKPEILEVAKLSGSPHENIDLDRWEIFTSKFSRIHNKYNEIVPKSGFKAIKASLRDHLENTRNKWDSLAPSVVLILGKENDRNVACFTYELSAAVSESFNEDMPVKIAGEIATQTVILSEFDKTLGEHHRHAIVLNGVEKLDGKAAMTLHRYTDHEISEYKDAILILVGYTDLVDELNVDSSPKELDKVASNMIEKSLSKYMTEDQIWSLISRLTPSVTAVLHNANSETSVC
ncbi:hypothetical protein HDE_07462 [Halotydeus destructor]|nr:hypothetical protein HDE_07462 [Halotydeus destructor]